MPERIPYLPYDGNGAAALRFNERALGGKIELRVRRADTPMAAQTPKEHAGRILHGRLARAGGGVLYAGDCPPHMSYQGIHGVGVTLNFETVERAGRAFNARADGGKLTMPLQRVFWAKIAAMVTGRSGVPWIVNGELAPVAAE